jgi:hypothetical protein
MKRQTRDSSAQGALFVSAPSENAVCPEERAKVVDAVAELLLAVAGLQPRKARNANEQQDIG